MQWQNSSESNSLPSLREGLDKVMLTVREKNFDPKRYKYDKHIANMFADRLTSIKFGDRYADTIKYEKYKWQTWKHDNIEKSSFGVQYFLRIDGMRQMRVLLNCQRLYNIFNNLEIYDKRLFDDNVVIPSVNYYLEEFIEIVQRVIYEAVNDYIALRKKVFNQTVTFPELTVDTHQIEMVREGIGLHTSDLSHAFKQYSRADTITVFHNQTNTHYLNTNYRRQLKMYQKGVGIIRLEATYNDRPQDLVFNWSSSQIHDIARSLRRSFDKLLQHMGIPDNWWESRVMKKQTFVYSLAEAINLRSKKEKDTPSEVLTDLMLILLVANSWNSTKDNQIMTRWLKRKGLLKHSGRRGIYIPTDRLMFLKDIFWTYCEKENWHC